MRLSVVVFVENGEGFAPVRRRRDIGDARSMPKLDIRFLREPPPADVLKQGPGEKEGVETDVALRERIEPRLFVSERQAGPSFDSACFEKVGSDPGNSASRAVEPPASRACACFACGVPGRPSGPSGSASRSSTLTLLK
jgi:hypothetical protein